MVRWGHTPYKGIPRQQYSSTFKIYMVSQIVAHLFEHNFVKNFRSFGKIFQKGAHGQCFYSKLALKFLTKWTPKYGFLAMDRSYNSMTWDDNLSCKIEFAAKVILREKKVLPIIRLVLMKSRYAIRKRSKHATKLILACADVVNKFHLKQTILKNTRCCIFRILLYVPYLF